MNFISEIENEVIELTNKIRRMLWIKNNKEELIFEDLRNNTKITGKYFLKKLMLSSLFGIIFRLGNLNIKGVFDRVEATIAPA